MLRCWTSSKQINGQITQLDARPPHWGLMPWAHPPCFPRALRPWNPALNFAEQELCRIWYMYHDDSTCMYTAQSKCVYHGHNTCMYCDHSLSMYYDHGTCMRYDRSKCVYADHNTCKHYHHITCMYYEHSTCMHHNHSTCMYKGPSARIHYDHGTYNDHNTCVCNMIMVHCSACIMSYRAHVRRHWGRGVGGRKP